VGLMDINPAPVGQGKEMVSLKGGHPCDILIFHPYIVQPLVLTKSWK
jgi:hypothetical protein